MKKLFLGVAFLGLMVFALPTEVKAESPCETAVITCSCDGSQHIVIVCEFKDIDAWRELLCCPIMD